MTEEEYREMYTEHCAEAGARMISHVLRCWQGRAMWWSWKQWSGRVIRERRLGGVMLRCLGRLHYQFLCGAWLRWKDCLAHDRGLSGVMLQCLDRVLASVVGKAWRLWLRSVRHMLTEASMREVSELRSRLESESHERCRLPDAEDINVDFS